MNCYEKILFVFTNDVFLCLAELAANAERIQSVLSMGQNLIERKKCAGSEDAVHQRIESISEQWEVLSQKTTEKSMRLKEANRQRTFIAAVKVIAYKYFNFTNFFPRFYLQSFHFTNFLYCQFRIWIFGLEKLSPC